jgi:hypothetical protein
MNEVDLGLERTFKIKEKQAITLEAQAFNLLNADPKNKYKGISMRSAQSKETKPSSFHIF